jgi:hypothetical protein
MNTQAEHNRTIVKQLRPLVYLEAEKSPPVARAGFSPQFAEAQHDQRGQDDGKADDERKQYQDVPVVCRLFEPEPAGEESNR